MKDPDDTSTHKELYFCPFTMLGTSLKLVPYAESKQRPKEEADPSRLVGGRFNKWGNLHTRLERPQDQQISAPAHQNLKFYIDVLLGFHHIFRPDGLNNNTLLSQGCVLEAASAKEIVGRMHSQGQGRGWGTSDCQGPS